VPAAAETAGVNAALGPSGTFTDAEIRAHLGPAVDLRNLNDDFDFLDYLLPGPVAPDFSLTMLGAPTPGGFAGELSVDLLLRLEEMSEDARASRIEELKGMAADTLERENNAARNYYMLNGLGLGDAHRETLWGGAVVPAKRKAPAEAKQSGKSSKKPKKQKDPVVEKSESEENSSESDSEGAKADEPARKKAPAPARARGTASTAKQIKEWATSARALLENEEFGGKWGELIRVWWAREEAAGFEGTVSNRCRRGRLCGNLMT
jgi:hypothetical protein